MHPLINLKTARAKAIETASIVAITVTESIAAVIDYLYHDSIIIGDVDENNMRITSMTDSHLENAYRVTGDYRLLCEITRRKQKKLKIC